MDEDTELAPRRVTGDASSLLSFLFLISSEKLDRVVRWSLWYGIAGMAGIAGACLLGTSSGVISGVMALALGAGGSCMGKWRTEPGLWMFSLLMLAMFLPSYAGITYFLLADAVEGIGSPLLLAIDFAIGTCLLGMLVRVLLTVTVRNRKVASAE